MDTPPTNEIPPPLKRYRFELTLDVHDLDHLADELRYIASDADHGDIPAKRVSGAGYWFTLDETEPTMTKERYEAELQAWSAQRRAARREQ